MKNSKTLIIIGASFLLLVCFCAIVLGIILFTTRDQEDESTSQTDYSKEQENDEATADSTNATPASYNCLFEMDDSTIEFEGYIFSLVVSDKQDVEWGEIRNDNGVRQIDLDNFLDGNSKDGIYFAMKRKDESIIENMEMQIQACTKDNKTVSSSYLEDKNTNPFTSSDEGESYLSTMQLDPYSIDTKPQEYRMDALVYYQGQWQLVARIDDIKFN